MATSSVANVMMDLQEALRLGDPDVVDLIREVGKRTQSGAWSVEAAGEALLDEAIYGLLVEWVCCEDEDRVLVLCKALSGWLSGVSELATRVLTALIPSFVWRYCNDTACGVSCTAVEGLLLCMYNQEVHGRRGKPQKVTLPVMGRPSAFHNPLSGASSERREPFPVSIALPLEMTVDTTRSSMLDVASLLFDVYLEAMSGYAEHVLLAFCQTTARLCRPTTGPLARPVAQAPVRLAHVTLGTGSDDLSYGYDYDGEGEAGGYVYDESSDGFYDAEQQEEEEDSLSSSDFSYSLGDVEGGDDGDESDDSDLALILAATQAGTRRVQLSNSLFRRLVRGVTWCVHNMADIAAAKDAAAALTEHAEYVMDAEKLMLVSTF